jgi:hypothetical protein
MANTFFKVIGRPEAVASGPQFVHPADFRTRGEAELFAQAYKEEHPGYVCEIEERIA